MKKSEEEKASKSKEGSKRGFDEIDSLFEGKKKRQKDDQKRKADQKQAAAKNKAKKKPPPSRSGKGEWVDDGLGGVYNNEGYTGRIEDGIKVFKAHVLQKPNAGQTAKCPFDCDCCFI